MKQLRSEANWRSPRPYEPGVMTSGLVFLSGHVPADVSGDVVGSGGYAQAYAVLENIERTLAAGGLDRHHIASTTVYLTDIAQIDGVDDAYRDFFGSAEVYPSRTTIEVSSLGRPQFMVEISAIATTVKATAV